MRFPTALCGYWSLISCTNPLYLGSTLVVDYTNFKFTHYVKKYGPVSLRKSVYGSVRLQNETAKVVISKKMEYSLESKLFPRIPIPIDNRCPRFTVQYTVDDAGTEMTLVGANEKYLFRKQYVALDDGNHFYKIFMTQLVFDLLLRHLPKF